MSALMNAAFNNGTIEGMKKGSEYATVLTQKPVPTCGQEDKAALIAAKEATEAAAEGTALVAVAVVVAVETVVVVVVVRKRRDPKKL